MTILALLAAAVILAGFLGWWMVAAWRAGRDAERRRSAERTADVQDDMLDAAADRPRDRGELADRLRDGRF